ncbi:MAG: agmatinase [Bacteroidaceae bacterium]|nr:agmatinase [Bacteroidaceae bacterium]
MRKNIETFIACDAGYDDAGIVIFGAPFDSTVSYRPGARFGSAAIRHESYGLETYSPYQDRDLEDIDVFDSGDLELPMGSAEMALDAISERTAEILSDGKLPLMLGGEHLVTLGAFRAVQKKYPDLHIIHFDAHTDLRDNYLGVKLSHACVIRRCHDIVGDGRIHQFGIRSGDRTEWMFARDGHTDLHPFNLDDVNKVIGSLNKGTPVYLTVDLDVLDPSVFPGTGTPEADGVTFKELLGAMLLVCGKMKVVGCDVNELAPMLDASGTSTAVACKFVRELLLALDNRIFTNC